ncbi:MAG: pantoate--beta-alanine ligase, partial [Candidatus Omnitrophota bacterium]
MIITKNVGIIREVVSKVKMKGGVVGFVPTMGAIHQGHLSLVRAARSECDFVVVSIFVNPLQFGSKEDYKKYPRARKRDESMLRGERADLVFCPSVKQMHSQHFSTFVEEAALSQFLCGKSRPRHFRGVCTVVAKLFNIVNPDIAYFGQKDYQQAQIIKRMVSDLNFPVKIRVLGIVRERDGLAMSSRNTCLNSEQRRQASCLYLALLLAQKLIEQGEKNPVRLKQRMRWLIEAKKATKVDYAKIVNPETLQDVKRIDSAVLIALAVYVGGTR